AVTVRGDIDYPQIDAEEPCALHRRRIGQLEGQVQSEAVPFRLEGEVGLPQDRVLQSLGVVATGRKGDLLAAREERHRGDGDAEEPQYPAIIGDGTQGTKRGAVLLA